MTNEQQVFLKLVSSTLSNFKIEEKLHIDPAVSEIADMHRCEPCMYYASLINNIDCPEKWKYKTLYGAIDSEKKLYVQSKVIKILEDASVDYAILKGASVARYYNISGIRLFGDVDILVREKDYEKAVKLISPGTDFKENGHEFHCAVTVDDVSVEIHRHVTNRSDDENGRKLYETFINALDETETVCYEGHTFSVLSNKFQALVLLLHKLRHMNESKFVLRLVIDWAFFVASVDEVEWKNTVYPFIKEFGLHLYADAITLCAQEYMGIDNSEKIIEVIDGSVAGALMEILMNGGVGNSRNLLTYGIGSIYERNLRTSNLVIALFKSLNEIAKRQFSLAKHTFFLPFFWIYIPTRYMFKLILGKRDSINVSAFADSVKTRKKVYESLNLEK